YLTAREVFKDALARDPGFALAASGTASTFATMAIDGWERPAEAWPLQEEYIALARRIDPDRPEMQVERTVKAFFFDWEFEEAERGWTRILQSPSILGRPDFVLNE